MRDNRIENTKMQLRSHAKFIKTLLEVAGTLSSQETACHIGKQRHTLHLAAC